MQFFGFYKYRSSFMVKAFVLAGVLACGAVPAMNASCPAPTEVVTPEDYGEDADWLAEIAEAPVAGTVYQLSGPLKKHFGNKAMGSVSVAVKADFSGQGSAAVVMRVITEGTGTRYELEGHLDGQKMLLSDTEDDAETMQAEWSLIDGNLTIKAYWDRVSEKLDFEAR